MYVYTRRYDMGMVANSLGGKNAFGVIVIMVLLAAASFVCAVMARKVFRHRMTKKGGAMHPKNASFVVNNSGEIDDVNEAAYNATQMIKQSVLLEEHLNCPRKRCHLCILKHLCHLGGLAEEAVSLAGTRVGEYPLLDKCPVFYQTMLDEYRKCKKDPQNKDGTCRAVADKIRLMRRDLTKAYLS